MIAEIYGKISRTGTNLSEKLEDELTGNVFGTLRYIPFSVGLQPIICNSVYPTSIAQDLNSIHAYEWSDNIQFWPYDEIGELDAYLEFENVVIGIEVKYLSGLSSDDGPDYSGLDENTSKDINNSSHQLQREARIISKKGNGKKRILLLIADSMCCADIYSDVEKRKLLDNIDIEFGYVSWQSFLRELQNLDSEDQFHRTIISDLIQLLNKKGFNQFESMELADNYSINENHYFKFPYAIRQRIDFVTDKEIKGGNYYEFK